MQSIKLNIKTCSNSEYLLEKQRNYSYAFHKLYRRIDLIKNKQYLAILQDEFNLSDIEIRSLASEVQSKFDKTLTDKKDLEKEIVEIENEIKETLLLPKTNKNVRTLHKLRKDLAYKLRRLPQDITFGSKTLLKKLSYLNNDKELNAEKIIETKAEYVDKRIMSFYLLGEANQYGNRFINFDLENNKLEYKPKRGTKIEIEFSCYHSYKKTLKELQYYSDHKLIPISLFISSDSISLSYDDKILNGFAINESERRNEVKEIKKNHIDPIVIKDLISKVYIQYNENLKQRMLNKKLNYRYLAIDTNPDYIGCSIIDKVGDKDIKVVHAFNYNVKEQNEKTDKSCDIPCKTHVNNQRKYSIYHIWKDIFKVFSYYNCGYLVLEELDFKNDDLGNKEANRKTKNLWYRTISSGLIDKYCNRLGIIKIEINPVYTSFIGNILHPYVDPINASIEIGRRGIFKFIKDMFYPEFDMGTILNTMSRLNQPRDVSVIKDRSNWVEAYREVAKSELRYRANIEDLVIKPHVVCNVLHSKAKKEIY